MFVTHVSVLPDEDHQSAVKMLQRKFCFTTAKLIVQPTQDQVTVQTWSVALGTWDNLGVVRTYAQ